MPRQKFEEALRQGSIVIKAVQSSLPPWLEALEGQNLAFLDTKRLGAKKSHLERIESRLLLIAPVLDNLPHVLSSESIESQINIYARSATPRQHETRFRLWVLTYLCFGRNLWALLPPFHLAGRWSREVSAIQKQGAPSKAFGRKYGHKMSNAMAERCVKAYVKLVSLGAPMSGIYAEAMRKEFGCKTILGPSGLLQFFHPNEVEFPTERQFSYQVQKSIGIENVQKNRYGSARHRRRLAATTGKFTADVSNLLEKVEADGYYTAEKPKGYLEGSVLPPLCVVTARDMLSGMKLGIGFSFGKENGAAYRMMLFSMAVPKEYFCQLWGLRYRPGEWPSEGLPPHFKVDRGPGSRQDLIQAKDARPEIRNLTPSWSGQSKATVESSHPREVKFEGQPRYFASQLTPVALARREIYALIRYNRMADMSGRMELDRELALIAPTPLALWNHYDARFRNSGVPICIDDAVRAFLTPLTFKARKDGVYLDSRCFNSNALREYGFLERIARSNQREVPVQGYMLDLCVRHIWIEVDAQMFLLDAQLRIREDDELLFMSFAELAQWGEARARVNSAFVVHQAAVAAESLARFEDETGTDWNAGQLKSGKVKRNGVARQEALEALQHTSKRKSA
jgi:hypothetical protein